MERRAFLTIVVFGLIIASAHAGRAEPPRQGPDGRIRVLYMGDAISTMYLTPYMFMRIEPLIQVTPVIASEIVAMHSFGFEGREMVTRAIRLYMPRNYQQMLDTQDVLILSDATLYVFNTNHLAWMARSVREAGLGLVMAGGHESFHMGGWVITEVAQVLPVQMLPHETGPGFGEILEPEHELIRSIPWDQGFRQVNFGGSNGLSVKQGSTELATFQISSGGKNPMMVTGMGGEGRSFAFSPDWTWGWGGAFSQWEYYGDFCNNLMLHLARQPVPEDVEVLHVARKELLRLDISRGLLVSLFDFVERFGANPAPLEDMLEEVDSLRREADALYIGQDFEAALDVIVRAIEAAEVAEDQAVRLKNAALFWIYLIEWMVVTATILVSGVVLWSLMVRRRFFRQVGSTRFV